MVEVGILVSVEMLLMLRREILQPGALRDVSKGWAKVRLGWIFQSFESSFKVVRVRASSSKLETPPKLLIRRAMSSEGENAQNARSLSDGSRR